MPEGGECYSSALVKIAQKDFKAAKLLFRKRLYPQALFMFQQSLEKAAKALHLKLSFVGSEQDLIDKLGHEITRKTLEMSISRVQKIFSIMLMELEELKGVPKELREEFAQEVLAIVKDPYEKALARKGEMFKTLNEVAKRAFDAISKEFKKDVEVIAGVINYSIQFFGYLIGLLLKEIAEIVKAKIATPLSHEGLFESIKKQVYVHRFSLLANIYLVAMVMWHAPFEDNVGELRYRRLTVEDDSLLVQWSKRLMKEMEKAKVLKRLEELIEEKDAPEFKKLLDAMLDTARRAFVG